jgi:CubicO group peptidase (beta-lactamase class C family)
MVAGRVAPGFEPVRDAFEANFAARADVGAAFAACVDGMPVVDLWAGAADREARRPWSRDSLQLVFSTSKGMAATALLLLVEQCGVSLDDPVARYWPEFAAGAKSDVSVADALSHQAGVPALRDRVEWDDLLDPIAMAERVAREPARWPGRRVPAYHALTYGWIAAELVRRVTGVSLGRFFDETVATPLGLEAWIGLPPEHAARVTRLTVHQSFRDATATMLGGVGVRAVYENPPIFAEPLIWNEPRFREAEIAGVNGIATARALATMYGCLACRGEHAGGRLVREATLEAARRERARGLDALTDEHVAFGAGYQLQTPDGFYGPCVDAFGHGGAGGSMAGCWPSKRTGFAYVMNEMRDELTDDRSRVLLASLYVAVANRR